MSARDHSQGTAAASAASAAQAPLAGEGVLPLQRCAQIKIPAGINQGLAAASTVAPVVYSLPWWYKSLGNRNAPGCTTTMIWSTFSIIASCDHIIMISCHNVIIQANFLSCSSPKMTSALKTYTYNIVHCPYLKTTTYWCTASSSHIKLHSCS